MGGFCSDLFYAKLNPALPLLKGALTFSPVKYANELIDDGKLKTAEDYIEFYTGIPGIPVNHELEELQKSIYEKDME